MNDFKASWPVAKISDITVEAVGGGTPSRKNPTYWGGQIPWTRSAHIDSAGNVEVADWITEEGLAGSSSNVVPLGCVLVGTRVGIGKVALAPFDIAISQDLTGLVPNEDEIDPSFFVLALRGSAVQEQFGRATRGSTIKGVPRTDLLSFEVPVPPLPEQRAIAHVLRTVQQAREATEQVIAAARELKRSMMRHLFTYGPVPPREAANASLTDTPAGPMPEHWTLARMDEIASIERGKFSHRPRNDRAYYGGSIPFIQTGDVTASDGHVRSHSQTLNDLGLSVSRVFPRGTIVITIAANIGYTGILEFDSAFPDSLIGITPGEGISAEFLNYYLTTQQPEMDQKAPQGTQKNINIQFLRPWPIKLSPKAEQDQIVSVLHAVDQKIDIEEQRRDALDALFSSLLHDLMTARIRVPVEEFVEVAS